MVNGLCGSSTLTRARSLAHAARPLRPSVTPLLVSERVVVDAPTGVATDTQTVQEMGDGWDASTTAEDDRLELSELGRPVHGPDMRPGSAYHTIFGDIPLEEAVLTMFCQAAKVTNMLFGDNQYSYPVMADSTAVAIADAARFLGEMVQVLLGPVHTTKLHRLMYHLLQELRGRGNLVEGDTSTNESKHSLYKQMYRRTNKRGSTLPLQMLRADETQDNVMKVYEQEQRAKRLALGGDASKDDVETASYRGVRVSLLSVAAWAGLSALASCLGVDADTTTLTLGNTVTIVPKFEWGTPSTPAHQFVRGAEDFYGSAWQSHVLYMDVDGAQRWGQVRVVLRGVNGEKRQAVVVQCMREALARPGCALTRYGCQRLAWDFSVPDDDWPRLAVVEVSSIVRVEQVHVDWWDLARRLGVRTMPSSAPDTADERRSALFFSNAFYPWVSRSQNLNE